MKGARKRSVVWRFFEAVEPDSVQCLLCRSYQLKRLNRSTTNMLKHLRQKHPGELSQRSGEQRAWDMDVDLDADADEDADTDVDREGICSVEVLLEDEATPNSILAPLQEDLTDAKEQTAAGDGCSSGRTRHKRSLIWEYFERLDGVDAASCSICKRKLQCGESGGTSNLRRHMLKRHPKEFSELTANEKHPATLQPPQVSRSNKEAERNPCDTEGIRLSVAVSLEDEVAINSILAPLQEDPTDNNEHTAAGDGCSPGRTQNKRSLIWKYFERLDGLDAARCSICKRKLQCFENSGTSNLRRHMLKRHPKEFSELTANGKHPAALQPPPESRSNKEAERNPWDTAGIRLSGPLKVSRPSEGETRVLIHERELIEALRRTQREEARTLDHQRELMERLRAADARDAAAEREQIEMLRRAQQEEADDLNRQREELQQEKEELQKKWEELRQEREDFLSLSK